MEEWKKHVVFWGTIAAFVALLIMVHNRFDSFMGDVSKLADQREQLKVENACLRQQLEFMIMINDSKEAEINELNARLDELEVQEEDIEDLADACDPDSMCCAEVDYMCCVDDVESEEDDNSGSDDDPDGAVEECDQGVCPA